MDVAQRRALVLDVLLLECEAFLVGPRYDIEVESGSIMRWKLTPPERMATISEFAAMREVKKMTEMNTNIALYMFTKYGMKLT